MINFSWTNIIYSPLVELTSYTHHVDEENERLANQYYWIEVQQIMQKQQCTLAKKVDNMEEDITMDTSK